MLYIIFFIILIAVFYIFYTHYPPFGGKTSVNKLLRSPNFKKKIFVNQIATSMSIKARDMVSLIREQLHNKNVRQPLHPIQSQPLDLTTFLSTNSPQLIWLGHSSVLLKIDGLTILTDPILSKRSSPFSFIGPKRTITDLPLAASELPTIDVVVISHDHYDHLDYATIRSLRHKVTKFFVPLGVAAHLRAWGVADTQIEELDWWETKEFNTLRLSCTPARHFSGRTLTDRYKTLWCSWVLETKNMKVFLSGDTGYGPHFKQIGDKYGPFELTLMECGQYDSRWPNIHMMPEDTVQAHQDLKGKRMFPIHWGAFVLALHPWAGSVQRADTAAQQAQVHLLSSKIGETLHFMETPDTQARWWNQ